MLEDKVRDIGQRLLERSRANEVNWLAVNDFVLGALAAEVSRRLVRFSDSSFVLDFVRPPAEPDWFNAAIKRGDGVTVASLKASLEDGKEDWELLSSLWSEAERFILKWDTVLAEFERNLNTPGTIGLPEEKKK